ncbi:Hypothetical predicted protein [Mytilus galloprovincialis]|uniref:Uncharacterized protein n=1 Tax=Mytilus galloprovincialis TaxID=29158 RepID=A0A8B6BKZ8_MYTGA|nr:Hypothetical predicted protein [Mytilus galloprovincialis]
MDTLRSNKKAGNTLSESEMDIRFKEYDEVRLNEALGQFYMNARKPDGNHYKISRGQKNMHLMTKTTFGVATDPATGLKVVRKVETEMTKKHRETDKEDSSGVMPEVKGR